MAAEVAIVNILSNNAGLLVALGSPTGTNAKVHMGRAPQREQAPFVLVVRESTLPSDTKGNVSRVDEEMIKVSCYATDYASSLAISLAMRAAIDGITAQSFTIGIMTVNIDAIWFHDEIYAAQENVNNVFDMFEQTYSVRVKY